MAHPDKTRGGSEKGQRAHAGQTSASSDAGMKRKSQGIAGGADRLSDGSAGASAGTGDASRADIFPEAHREEGGSASEQQGLDRDAGGGPAPGSPKKSPRAQKSHIGKR